MRAIKLFLTTLFILFCLKGDARDSLVYITADEARILVMMTEDLKYTKMELSAADSLIKHQSIIIQDQSKITAEQDNLIQTLKNKNKKTKISSFLTGSGIGLILGTLLGLLIR